VTGLVPVALLIALHAQAHATTALSESSAGRLDVPYLSQSENLCGGAAAAMVMRYWGAREVEPQAFAALVRPDLKGIRPADLTAALTARGWNAYSFSGSSVSARHHLAQGRPVIALIRVRSSLYHFIVIVGWTDAEVIYHDPAALPNRKTTASALERVWAPTNHWMLVLVPGTGQDRTRTNHGRENRSSQSAASRTNGSAPTASCAASIDEGVSAAHERRFETATAALQRARRECPESARPLTELASLELLQRNYVGAVRLAEDAVVRSDADDQAWTVLATARFLLRQPEAALDAWNRTATPTLDLVRIDGLSRTRYGVAVRALDVSPGSLLTRADLQRARRRLAAMPTVVQSRLDYVPAGDGLVDLDAAVVERSSLPGSALEWAAVAGRTVTDRELAWHLSSPTGNGELLSAEWRWWEGRPRVAIAAEVPVRSTRLAGVFGLAGALERQQYDLGGSELGLTEVRRRTALASWTSWLSGSLRWQAAAGVDRWDRRGTFPRVGGLLDLRLAQDRVTVRTEANTWFGSETFVSALLTVAARRAAIDDRLSLSGVINLSAASDRAPLDLWPGADTGRSRPYLLRAHPLLDDRGVVRGTAFGRELANATAEVSTPIARRAVARLDGATFVDVARSWRGPTPGRVLVDWGIGVRVHLAAADTLRIDVAHGLTDGANALSIGWQTEWSSWR
jgi:predicted double-glycine peptidase